MISRRSLLIGAAASAVPVSAVPARGVARRGGASLPTPPVSTVSYGTVFKYNSGYSAKYILGDVWTTTWADNGNLYSVCDDTYGWQASSGGGSNLQMNLLSSYATDGSMTGTLVNVMAAFGGVGQGQGGAAPDNATWKGCGLISVGGVLYCAVSRQVYGTAASNMRQSAANAQIIKSTDHGITWTPLPTSAVTPYASPMFPGSNFGAPFFVQFGQNYANAADGYVYAISTNGWWNNGDALYCGRCLITDLPALDATKWTFYNAGTWDTLANATPILSSPLKLSMTAVQYLPAFSCYIMFQWWYPGITGSNGGTLNAGIAQWDVYTAPNPWGPWSMVAGQSHTWQTAGAGQGLYNPCIVPSSLVADGGRTAMIITAGNYNSQSAQTGEYTLTLVPVTLS